jgi:hypothetical protein
MAFTPISQYSFMNISRLTYNKPYQCNKRKWRKNLMKFIAVGDMALNFLLKDNKDKDSGLSY